MNNTIKIIASAELLAAMSTRDAEGNRLSFEIGEPDPDGFYTPYFAVHYDDNLVEAARREIAVDDLLLAERDRLLDVIPECPQHGDCCIPNAIEWVLGQVSKPIGPVMSECFRQDEKWGVQDHGDAAWLMVLAEEMGEAAELVLATMQPGDPYRANVRRLVEAGKKAKAFIGDACELGAPQHRNIPGVEKEAVQITAVGLTWLKCMERRIPPTAEEKP